MKIAIILLGFVGLICNTITAALRFANATNQRDYQDGVAWLLLGFFVLVCCFTTARDW